MIKDLPVVLFVNPTSLSYQGTVDPAKSRETFRKALQVLHVTHDATIEGFLGEAAVLSFPKSQSAVEFTQALIVSSKNISGLTIKAGANHGKLVENIDGLYGEGVTKAVGFAYHAHENALVVSEEIYEEIKGTISGFKPSGEVVLKSFKRPLEVCEISSDSQSKGPEERYEGVAIMPFANLSADQDLEFLSDGVSQEIAVALGTLPELRVVAYGSSLGLKKRNLNPKAIGKLLQVSSIVTGSVRRAGNQLRIGISLMSTADGKELWSENFEGRNKDFFEIMERIIRKIANLVHHQTLRVDSFPPQSIFGTRNTRSFDFYLRAASYLALHSPEEALKAISFFERAFDEDITNDRALAGMATGSSLIASFGYRNPSEYFENAIRYAKETLEINPNNQEAHVVLSYVSFYYRWDWEQGLLEINRALRIREASPDAHIARAIYFLVKGIFKEARKELNIALEIDPGSLTISRLIADSFYHEGEYAKAIKHYDEIIKQNPDFQRAVEYKGWALMMNGNLIEAIELFKALDNDMTLAIKSYTQLGYAYARKGDKERAMKYLEQIQRSEKRNRQTPHQLDLAILHVGLGQNDLALKYLEQCVEEKIGAVIFLKINPVWTPLRSDPGFKSLLKRLGLA